MTRTFYAAACAVALAITTSAVHSETFRWAYQSNVGGLDGMSTGDSSTRNLLRNVYEGLTRFTPDLAIEPSLATSWTLTSDTVWRFKLRPNVSFHDGSSFSADDVIFSFKRATAATSDVKARLRSIKEIRKVDDLTIDIETNGPSPTLLNDLTFLDIFDADWATKNGAVEPASLTAKAENFATRNANGTGPFRVTKFAPSSIEFVPFDKWWGNRTNNITQAIFTPITSDTTRVAALLSGQVDMIFPVPQQDVPRINASPTHVVLAAPEERVIFLGFDTSRDELLYSSVKGKNPFKDKRVRQAVYQAIDTATIRQKVMRSAAFEVDALISKTVVGWDPSFEKRAHPYDPTKASALLAEAGYPNGFSVTLDCPNDRYVNDEQICTAIVGMLARIGIKVDLLAQTRSLYFAKTGKRDTSFFLFGWSAGTDAQSTMQLLMHAPTEKEGSLNFGSYSNPRVDTLIRLIGNEMNREKRLAMFKEAFQTVRDDFGYIPLHGQMLAWGVNKKVSLLQRADDFLDLRFVNVK
jgi:peptide/nickel transport system substrate-binding protein